MFGLGTFMALVFAGFVVFIILLGVFYPGSGAKQLDWKPTRSPELDVQNDIDDVDQMLAAANARRRARGEAELTEETIGARVASDRAEMDARRAAYQAHRDAEHADEDARAMLDARNARRRKRGQPELTLEEFKATLGSGRAR